MTIPTKDAFYKTTDSKGEAVIVKMTLPVIDVHEAVARFPHEWSETVDGFAAAAPATVDAGPAAVGHTGGNNRLINGIGVKEVIRLSTPAKKGSASAA